MVITKNVHFCSSLVKPLAQTRNDSCHFANVLKMSKIDHLLDCGTVHCGAMKSKELTLKQILSVPCPTCGAAAAEACGLQTGAPRTEPHRDRKLSAAEAVETRPGKRSK